MSDLPHASLPAPPLVGGADAGIHEDIAEDTAEDTADDTADEIDEVVSMAAVAPPPADGHLDLDHIERDLADVEAALRRLDSGEYWTDEVTGAPLPDEHLVDHPTARRLVGR